MKQFLLFLLAAFCLTALVMSIFAGGFLQLSVWFLNANPLMVVIVWASCFSACSFFFGIFTGDYSWVDRLWSTLPVAFVWYYALRGGFSPALLTAAFLVSVWGVRLTWNFAKKGGYTGTEDYRWSILRGRIKNPLLWQIFNLLFISFFQIGLFILFTFPVYYLAMLPSRALPVFFVPAAVLAGLFILIETIADRQQEVFQTAKHSGGKVDVPEQYKEDIPRGFLTHGLFSVSRHPNYFGELGFWWSVWLMALAAGSTVSFAGALQTGLFGPLALTALFIGSTIFTESISVEKYPAYKDYRKEVSPIIPWVPAKKAASSVPQTRAAED